MKKAALIVLLFIIGGSAMATQHKHKKKSKPAHEIISIAMRRTGCYGRCPAYIIEINKNGMATYTAMRFTADSGVFIKNIGANLVKEIGNEVYDTRIDTCRDMYKSPNTDLPGLIFTITYADSVKTINNANYGPAALRQLTQTMDGIVGKKVDETWQRQNTSVH